MTSLNDFLASKASDLGHKTSTVPAAVPARPGTPQLHVVGDDDPRARAWVAAKLNAHVAALAAMAPGTGRNGALNAAAYSLGKFVPRWITAADVHSALLAAATSNGLVADDGERTCRATLSSGLEAGMKEPRDPPVTAPLAASPAAPAPVGSEAVTTGVTAEQAQQDWHDRQVAGALRDLRIKHDAQDQFKAELAAATFREPPSTFTLADELAIPDEPISYAIDELLPAGANALLAAQFKTGKTTLVNNYVRAFADGTPFLGRYGVNNPDGRIAVFNYEVGRDQYRRWLRDLNITNTDRVVILNLRGFRLPLTAPAVEDWVVRWLEEREVTAWVVDPFARASVGIDENSNSEVGRWLDTLDVIKQRAGVRDLALPTHTGRAEQEASQERARGTTRLDDWADVRWLLTKDKNDHRYFRATGRDVDVPEELLTYDEVTRELRIGGGDRKWVKDRALAQAVLDFINGNSGCGVKAIQQGVTGNKEQIDAVRVDLIRRHKVRVEDGPRNAILH